MRHEEAVGPNSPLYLQLRELIRGKIESGEYPPGTAIPSVGALAETYGIHRLSVRSAVSALVGEGLLKAVQGKGLFVVGEKLEQELETAGGFWQNLAAQDKTSETRVLCKALRPAGPAYGTLLGIDPEAPVYFIKQMCSVGGEPVSLEEIYLPEELTPDLEKIDLGVFSILEIQDFYGIIPVRGEQSLEITQLRPADARQLGAEPGRGVLRLQCVSYDSAGRAVELSRTYTRGDRCTFSVHFQRER